MERILPILSGSLAEILRTVVAKTGDPIAAELLDVHQIVEQFNNICYGIDSKFGKTIIESVIEPRITNEVRMITIRIGEFDVSFLPEGKEPEYGPGRTWSRRNRQTGKPARIFQKLLKKEFKTREWEVFTNIFKAELCQCTNFQLVEGEDIRKYYLCDNYYKCDGTLGNSCMRYDYAQPFFDIYVDNAQMLITTKDGLLTGRAVVWRIGDITIMDRVYTCFDYLENCFYDYARSQGWWYRENNSLLDTGDDQWWYTPDNNYESCVDTEFTLTLPKLYMHFPYMDSFRYYDGNNKLSTHAIYDYSLDSTEGEYRGETYVCESCGDTFYGHHGDTPEELHWSEWGNGYYCDDCCWYSDGMDDYIPNSENCVTIINRYLDRMSYPESFLDDYYIPDPDGTEGRDDIVMVDGMYYFVSDKIKFNEETQKYEIRPNPS